MCALALYP
jgi:hypothetical protein